MIVGSNIIVCINIIFCNVKKTHFQTKCSYISAKDFYCHLKVSYGCLMFLLLPIPPIILCLSFVSYEHFYLSFPLNRPACAFHSYREKLNSMNLLLYMSPIAVLVLVPAVLIMEPNVLEVILSLGK